MLSHHCLAGRSRSTYIHLHAGADEGFPSFWGQVKTVEHIQKKVCAPCENPYVERTLGNLGHIQKKCALTSKPLRRADFRGVRGVGAGATTPLYIYYIFSSTLLTYSNPIPLFSTTTNSPQTFKLDLPLALCPTNYLFTTFLASSKRGSPYEIRTLIVLKVLKVNICTVGHIPIFMLPYLPH